MTSGEVDPGATGDLLARAQAEPQAVIDLTAFAAAAPPSHDACVALRAKAIAHRILGDNDQALAAIMQARAMAAELGDEQLEAACLMSNAPLLAQAGDLGGAFDLLDRAEAVGGELHLAEVEFQRAGLALLIADWRRARDHYSRALVVFRRTEEKAWQAEALLGRGLMAAYLGDHGDAASDLAESRAIFDRVGDMIGVGQAAWNTALATLLSGDPARAVVEFDRAGAFLEESGFPLDLFLGDQADALFAVGLHEEAIALARHCVEAYEVEAAQSAGDGKVRNVLDAASRRLELSRTLALTGHESEARSHAELAMQRFDEHGQVLRRMHAELILLDLGNRADHAARRAAERAAVLRTCLADARQLEWATEAALVQARRLVDAEEFMQAQQVVRSISRRYRTFTQELARFELSARIAWRQGRTGSALRFARRSLRFVRAAPRLQGTSFIDVAISRQVEALIDIGMAALLTSGRARDAVAFAAEADFSRERTQRPQPPSALVAEYRSVARALEEAEIAQRDAAPIAERQRRLAGRIRVQGTGILETSPEQPKTGVGPETMRRWAIADGDLWALDTRGGRCASSRIGRMADIAPKLDELTTCIRREVHEGYRPSRRLARAAAKTDAALGFPGRLGDEGEVLFLAPAPQLGSITFGLLPSLQPRRWARVSGPLSRHVPGDRTTSGSIPREAPKPPVLEKHGERREATRGGSRHEGRLLIAGPGLEFASGEVRRIAAMIRAATTLTGRQATCSRVLAAIEQADVVHVAAHSSPARHSPMFGSILLYDGELYLHELESLSRAPRLVVFASCESAAERAVGTSSIGMATGLLRAGVGAFVGTSVAIPDCEETSHVMAVLHEHLQTEDATTAVFATRTTTSLNRLEQQIAATLVPCVPHP